ncbi:MAG: O-antigen ligase family protein [Elusimicrobia bacterium]|nr:O-antigen ligase family protein [Elusimicrobiota bacterium]
MTPELAVEAGLVAVALALPLSIAAMNLALAALTLAVLGCVVSGRLRWRRDWTPALLAAAAYAAAAAVSAAAGPTPKSSLLGALKDWHRVWSLAVLLLAFSSRRAARAPWGLAAGFSAAAAIGLWQSATGRAGAQWVRAHAFMHPVTYGEMLALALLGVLCLWGRPEAGLDNPRGKSAGAAFLVLIGAALVLNQTRGAFAGLGLGYFAACLLNKELRRWTLPALVAAVVVAAVWEILPTGRPLSAIVKAALSAPSGTLNPQLARWRFWSVAWRAFADHPWLGVGPGNYKTAFEHYSQGPRYNQLDYGSAHNLYLHQLAERGVLGIAALGALLWTLTARAWVRAKRAPFGWSLWAWGATAAFLVMNLTEVALQSELAATFLLMIWAWPESNNSYN